MRRIEFGWIILCLLWVGCGREASPTCWEHCVSFDTLSILDEQYWRPFHSKPAHLMDSLAIGLRRAREEAIQRRTGEPFHLQFQCWQLVRDSLRASPYWVEFLLTRVADGQYHVEEFGGSRTLFANAGRERYNPFFEHELRSIDGAFKLVPEGGDFNGDGSDFLRFADQGSSAGWWNENLQAMVTLRGRVALSQGEYLYHFLFSHGNCGPGNHRLEYSELFFHPAYGPVCIVFPHHDLGVQIGFLHVPNDSQSHQE